MEDRRSILGKYQTRYADLGFERGGLFEFLRKTYHPKEVLYPGCSVHITPAFCFPNVVFVDHDPAVKAFFSNREMLLDVIKRNRRYRPTPHIQFFDQDFRKPLPVRKNQFGLLLAIFTGAVSKTCSAYLADGGLLITNNHQNDSMDALRNDALTRIGIIRFQKGKYRLVENETGEPPRIKSSDKSDKRYLQQKSRGYQYVENENYY